MPASMLINAVLAASSLVSFADNPPFRSASHGPTVALTSLNKNGFFNCPFVS